MQQALPVFAFSYVLIRDHVLDMANEETGLKYLKYIMDQLRKVYDEVQAGTHGTTYYKDMEAPDYSNLFAPDQIRANFGAHPMERYQTVRMLQALQRFLRFRLEQRLKYGFTAEEWLAIQIPPDTSGSDADSASPHEDGEAVQSEESNESVMNVPPIPFLEDEKLISRRNRKAVKTAITDAHRGEFLKITKAGVDFSVDTPKTHAKFFLRYLNEFIESSISEFTKRYVTVRGKTTEYEKIASKWPSSAKTRGTIRMYFQ